MHSYITFMSLYQISNWYDQTVKWNEDVEVYESIDKMLKEIWMIYLRNITLIYLRNINSLWPSDAIWWHRSGSTLAQVMACYLMAPSLYLNQYWLIISEVLWHSPEGNFTGDAKDILDMSLKITDLRLQPHLPGVNELKVLTFHSLLQFLKPTHHSPVRYECIENISKETKPVQKCHTYTEFHLL